MTGAFDAGWILAKARKRAGLTQRELAKRARTSQSVVARIESGRADPSAGTLRRLLEACGLNLRVALEPELVIGPEVLEDVSRIRRLTPEERMVEARNLSRFLASARRV